MSHFLKGIKNKNADTYKSKSVWKKINLFRGFYSTISPVNDGNEQWILIHVEVQGSKDDDFPKRMFTYGYRIWDKYQKPLVSCAILTDDNSAWRPNYFEVNFAGSRLSAEFLTIKLLDYKNEKPNLENSNNPFASVILVQLAALEYKSKSNEQRKDIKFALTRRLYDKGFSKQEITNLYKFIDWVIGLPREFEVDYLKNVYDLEEALKMPYVSTAERLGLEKGERLGIEKGERLGIEKGERLGIEKGKLEGKLEDAKEMLAEGCAPVFIAKITKLPLDKIKALQKKKD